ncbi:MAG TPA: polysaccharide biosynthesis/export family protein [Verrucomicrobiae bacterium]|nr:polysaccharide biosynthesis/export family protein [Verrucomicrobiae bacterium]
MKLFWILSRLRWQALGVVLAGFIFSGCSSSSNDILFSDNPQAPSALTGTGNPSTDTTSTDLTAARFHVGDTVTVDFSGTADPILEHTEPIKEDGTITLPYIGPVRALGKTAGELQNDIHDLYVPKYYVRLTITVSSPQRVFYVGGEVKQPGRQLYVGETTVTKAIQSAGDFTDFANQKKVKLIRHSGEVITVNCIKALQDPTLDPPVYPGDQVQVPRRIF